MGKAKPATVENAPVAAPKIEKPAEAKPPALSRQEVIDRWQGMSADERLQATLDSGMFTTKKGELSAIGKRFAAQESMEKAGDSRINGLAAAMGREESVRTYAENSGLISHSDKDKPLSEKQKEMHGKSYEQALKRESSGASFSQEDIGKLKLQKDTAVSLKNATGIGGKKLISIQNVHDKAGERIQIEQTENGLAIHFGGGLGRKYNTAGKTLQDVVDYVAGALRKRVEAKPKAQAAEKKSGGKEVSQQAKPNAFSDSSDSREVLGNSDVAKAYSAITPAQMDGKTTLKTNAGRTTAPIPKKGNGSPRAFTAFTHRLAKWLMTEAYKEAQHNQDSYHSTIFKQSLGSMKGKGDKRPTGYEDALARGYVFGDNTVPVRRDPFFEADASDDLKFSHSDNGHNSKSAYEAAKAAHKTELTFHQWQQVRTPEFKAWFGDWENDPDNASKVVNPRTGEPLAMYHGTSHSQEGNAFTRFDTYGSNYGLMGQGSYFTDNAGVASSYTEKGRGGNPSVYSVFLNIRNPIDMDAQADAQAWADAYPDAADYHDGGSTNESWFRAMEEALQADGVYAAEGAEQVAAAVAEMGYDGVSHIGGGRVASDGVKHRVYIAHEPNQIKSATGNSGAFDAGNDDIRYSRSAMKDTAANIRRGREAMNKAITESADVKRAMYRNDIGWVDFAWGAEGNRAPNGKTKGAMGLVHIIDKRMNVDGMSRDEVIQMLTRDAVETIAQGETIRHIASGKSVRLEVKKDGNTVQLTKREGSNSWLLTAYNDFENQAVEQVRGATQPTLRNSDPIRSRDGMGAPDTANTLHATPEQIKQTRQAIAEVLSEAHMRHIDVTTAAQAAKTRPEYARELVNAEGFFDPKTKKITLIADNLPNADVARFVAWHELGHRGVDVAGFKAWKSKFKSFYNLNPTFKALTDSIQHQRSGYNSKAPGNTNIFMEEAAVELYAAHKTGNYARLQEKYGVDVPKAARADIGGYLRRLANNLKRILAKAFGLNQNHFSDADIYDLLNGIDAATGETLSGSLNDNGRILHQFKNMNVRVIPSSALRKSVYHRRNNRDTPYNDVGYMQFAENEESVASYGENHWILPKGNDAQRISAGSEAFKSALREWLSDNLDYLEAKGFMTDSPNFIEDMVEEANPDDIVDSAGFWDAHEIMESVWDEVLEPNGWLIVETNDGAIVFEPELVERASGSLNEEMRFSRNETKDAEFARKAAVLQGEPVYTVTERKAPHGYPALREWAVGIFNRAGNKAVNPEIGEVVLNERSVRDSMAHRMNPFKAEAFAAVPAVIEKGVVVHSAIVEDQSHHFISASVVIDGKSDIVTVLVKQDANTNRMYIHSVITKESLLNASNSEAGVKTPEQNGKVPSGDIASILRSYLNYKPDGALKFSRGDNDHSSKSAQKSFDATAGANGGRRMYEQMKLIGDTELAYEQWVQVRTPEFKAWFGDWESNPDSASKILNPKTGEPLVVYHGSMSRFNVFDTELIYTTPDKDYTIVKNSDVKYGLFVNMRNPVKVDFKTIEYANNHPEKVSAIKKQGYDGMLFSAENDITALGGSANPFWDIPQFVSFEKSDVKSATGNSGTFDAKNDDIRFSMKTTPEVMAANTSKAIKAVSAGSITKALSGGRKAADLLKVGLQFLGRRQIVDIYGRLLPNLKTYSDIVQQMDAEKHDVSTSADKLADTWGKLKDGDALAALMHEATLAQIDADVDVGAQTGDDEVDNILLLGSKANIAFFPKSCIVVYV